MKCSEEGVKTMRLPDESNYSGDIKDGLPHGQGTITYLDGSQYIGGWKDGKKHGRGTTILVNGNIENAEWIDNQEVNPKGNEKKSAVKAWLSSTTIHDFKLKRVTIPLLLLLIILLASMFRWSTEATKAVDYGFLKWERDRWTGDLWLKGYTVRSSGIALALPEQLWTEEKQKQALTKMKILTKIRDILAGGMAFWLAFELFLHYRGKRHINTS